MQSTVLRRMTDMEAGHWWFKEKRAILARELRRIGTPGRALDIGGNASSVHGAGRAARAVMAMGPRAVVAKRGEYGAALFTEDGAEGHNFFALPGFPLEDVRDPTGAGDSFAGGFFGYLDGIDGDLDKANLRRAMGYGTVLASFNVEEFGTERVARLERAEIDERFEALRRMTQFEGLPAPRD